MSVILDNIVETEKARVIFYKDKEDSNFLLDIKRDYVNDYKVLTRLIERFAEFGIIHDETKFKHLEDAIYEFKTRKIRVLCYMIKGVIPKTVLLTHYHPKQKGKTPKREIEKAKRIAAEINNQLNIRKISL